MNPSADAALLAAIDLSPTELHGIGSGLAAADGAIGAAEIAEMIGTLRPNACDASPLYDLAQSLIEEMDDPNLGFQPFLATDEPSLNLQLNELKIWIDGFIEGFVHIASSDPPDDIVELISDFSDIVDLDPVKTDDNESELQFLQVLEHVRIGALLIRSYGRPTPR